MSKFVGTVHKDEEQAICNVTNRPFTMIEETTPEGDPISICSECDEILVEG